MGLLKLDCNTFSVLRLCGEWCSLVFGSTDHSYSAVCLCRDEVCGGLADSSTRNSTMMSS